MSTLANIRNSVRLLTKRTLVSQITDNQIRDYINTFYVYDFPQIVQTMDLLKNISFTTTPYVDTYSTTAGNFILNLKDFKDFVVKTDLPIYISGRRVQLYQNPEQFYSMHSYAKTGGKIGVGDGITLLYNVTLPTSILHNSVIIGTLNAAGEALVVRDIPNVDAVGREANTGQMHDQNNNNIGNINYITGVVMIAFPVAPAVGVDITYELFPFTPAIPTGVLFFDNTFTLRPVPDKVYEVKLQVQVQPTPLAADGDEPIIKQWWQCLAYGAAKKILEASSNYEGVNNIMPEYERQLILVQRKTHRNKSKERSPTIYQQSIGAQDWWNYYG